MNDVPKLGDSVIYTDASNREMVGIISGLYLNSPDELVQVDLHVLLPVQVTPTVPVMSFEAVRKGVKGDPCRWRWAK